MSTQFLDIVLLLDTSTSMLATTHANRTRLAAMQDAADSFVARVELTGAAGVGNRVSIVAFNGQAWTMLSLSSDREQIADAIRALHSTVAEGTRLDLGLDESRRVIGGARGTRVVVVVTDGLPNQVPTPIPSGSQEDTVLASARLLHASDALVFAVGIGGASDRGAMGESNPGLLRQVAGDPEYYMTVDSAEELAPLLNRLWLSIQCGP
ncbi:MAG: VWA domain-containing protein [Phycisphaerales bacterium]|nr:VWA domain-containing protein [Phycisphaerales bacterium]